MEDDEEDTEAGIHDRVQGTSGQASEDGEVDWFGSEGTGLVEQTLRNWVKLAAAGKLKAALIKSCLSFRTK